MQVSAKPMLAAPYACISRFLEKVKNIIAAQLRTDSESVNQLLAQVGPAGGKLLRPAMVLLAGKSCGAVTPEHIRVAAVVEMVHLASLLHDDVLDEARTRRARSTVNNLWGNAPAVLLGDLLLSKVFRLCAEFEQAQITKTLAEAAERMCLGELRQSIDRRKLGLNEAEYLDIIADKSGVFFGTCCYLGGLVCRATAAQLKALSEFGLNAGIAFQITDDLLDITGDEKNAGKSLGSDLNKNKPTLPLIHFLADKGDAEKRAVLGKLSGGRRERAFVANLLARSGSLDYAVGRAEQFYNKAVESLNELPANRGTKALTELARFMVQRDFD
jgi:octaprenyl-diphosphate synthase